MPLLYYYTISKRYSKEIFHKGHVSPAGREAGSEKRAEQNKKTAAVKQKNAASRDFNES